MTPEEARGIIDAFEEENREAYRLALAASLAARIEPELVRALRLDLFLEKDAGAEADLWFSPLVQSQTPLALEFEPEVLELLRQDLAREQELLQSAWRVLKEFHGDAPFALQLEEELTYLGLSGESNEAIIEKRLNSVLTAVSAGKRAGLARWASRALPSLPGKVSKTEAASRLSVVAGIQTRTGPVLTAMPSKGMTEEWLSEITATKISRVKVGLRLLKNDVPAPPPPNHSQISGTVTFDDAIPDEEAPDSLRPDVLPMIVEFSYPPVPESEVIEVPDTYRLLLEVSWLEDKRQGLRQLSLLPDEKRPVEVGYGEVRIRTALGDIFTLRPRFDYDLLLLYDPAVEQWARILVERLEQQEWRGKRLKVAASPLDERVIRSQGVGDELKTTFGLSRKVGFALRSSFALTQLEPSRPEPRGMRNWLIPIRVGSVETSISGGGLVIDFSDGGRFEADFHALWKAITGEDLPLSKTPQKAEAPRTIEPLRVFISYSHNDKKMREQLLRHLSVLETEGLIAPADEQTLWDNSVIETGQVWRSEINRALETAQIILLLVSADYLASDYAFGMELTQAIKRADAGEARVIPIILKPCAWKVTPISNFQVLPKDGKPITGQRPQSKAFVKVVEGIRQVAEQIQSERAPVSLSTTIPRPPVAGFVARRDDEGRDIVERLKEELAPHRNQLVTLEGPGGIGKTTLAAEAARALKEVFAGRIVWSSADGRTDFTLSTLLDDIATQLGRADLRPLAPDVKGAQVRELVASAPTLVVLDNYEAIAPETKKGIEDWFEFVQCSALFTSRHAINWTRKISIAAMSSEEAEEYLGRLVAQTQDSQVFSNEVRRRIYETTDANPYVMQWVVAQIDAAQQPGVVLEELTRGEGDAASRVFDRSFKLEQLGDDGRTALLALSLFAPSATHDALAEVAGFGNDLKRVDEAAKNLRALWLIKGINENSRFIIEGLTRSFARARLLNDDRADEFRRRFATHFLSYAKGHAQPTPEDFDALEAEKDNILGAVDSAFEIKDWSTVTEIAHVLTDPGNGVLSVRGHWDEAVRVGERAIQAARYSQNDSEIAHLSFNVAVMRSNRGEFLEARRLYEESLEIAKRLDNRRHIAVTLHQLGILAQDQGEFSEARRLYDESLEIMRVLDDQHNGGIILYQLATVAQDQGDLDGAQRYYNESLKIAKMLGDQSRVAITLYGLGRLAVLQGSIEEARRLYIESLHIQQSIGDQFGIATNLQMLGDIDRQIGDLTKAQQLLNESLAIYKRLGSQSGIAGVLHDLGLLAEQEGDKDEATRLLRESFAIFLELRSPSAEGVRRALANLEREAS